MSIKISFIGDVMLGENHYHFGRGIRTKYNGKYETLIDPSIKDSLFNGVDLLFLNFECSLTETGFIYNDLKSSIYRAETTSLSVFPREVKKIANIASLNFSGKMYFSFWGILKKSKKPLMIEDWPK